MNRQGRNHTGNECKALFRYQGGKQRLCSRLVDLFPSCIERYIEPFIGAASVYLELWNRGFRGPAFLGDWNPDVANVHRVVASDPAGFERAYARHVENHSRTHFYALRAEDASAWPAAERAARAVYLAKAAFHGLLRVDGNGRIVSTYGTGEPGRIALSGAHIRAVSTALEKADIRHCGFGWVEGVAQSGDMIFFDPPYVGGNCAFTAEGFNEADHLRLQRLCRRLDAKGISFLQTNSDRPFVRELYRDFHLLAVPPAAAIGRGGVGKQPVGEAIVTNYVPAADAIAAFEVAA